MFELVGALVENFLAGFNSIVFVYGQVFFSFSCFFSDFITLFQV